MPISRPENPGLPRRGFPFAKSVLRVGDREMRAYRQGRELINRSAAGTPVGKLFFVELRGHMRVPLARYRPDHRAGLELAAIDAHRALEAAPTSNVDSIPCCGRGVAGPVQNT
jgi:hypothetical protein